MTLDVTVVIPTRNRPAQTCRAVRSVLCQSRLPQHIVVVDDASSDDTAAQVAAQFEGQVELRVHPQRRGGNAARNTGAVGCQTRYIAFLDSDDVFLPHKLEQQVAALEASDSHFSCTGFVTETGQHFPLPAFSSRRLLIQNCLGGTSALMLSRAVFEKEQFNTAMLAVQDWEYYLRLVQYGAPVLLQAPGYVYGVSETDRVTRDLRKRALGHFQLYAKHIRHNPQAGWRVKFYHRRLQGFLYQAYRSGAAELPLWNRLLLRVIGALI